MRCEADDFAGLGKRVRPGDGEAKRSAMGADDSPGHSRCGRGSSGLVASRIGGIHFGQSQADWRKIPAIRPRRFVCLWVERYCTL